MAFLKQHRKATLELEGRKLIGQFEVSLTNQGDRETIVEFIAEMRKQLREFAPSRPKDKIAAKNTALKKKRKVDTQKTSAKARRKRKTS